MFRFGICPIGMRVTSVMDLISTTDTEFRQCEPDNHGRFFLDGVQLKLHVDVCTAFVAR